jgi:hypothetical protein
MLIDHDARCHIQGRASVPAKSPIAAFVQFVEVGNAQDDVVVLLQILGLWNVRSTRKHKALILLVFNAADALDRFVQCTGQQTRQALLAVRCDDVYVLAGSPYVLTLPHQCPLLTDGRHSFIADEGLDLDVVIAFGVQHRHKQHVAVLFQRLGHAVLGPRQQIENGLEVQKVAKLFLQALVHPIV